MEIVVGSDLCGYTGVLGLWGTHRMCVFGVCAVETYSSSYDGIHPQTILSHHERHKKGKYLGDCLGRQCNFTLLVFSVDGVMGIRQSKQVRNWLLPCRPNGAVNNRQHKDM